MDKQPPRLIRPGDRFIAAELEQGTAILEQPPPAPAPPPEHIQGESWLWTKGPPYPLDYEGRRPI